VFFFIILQIIKVLPSRTTCLHAFHLKETLLMVKFSLSIHLDLVSRCTEIPTATEQPVWPLKSTTITITTYILTDFLLEHLVAANQTAPTQVKLKPDWQLLTFWDVVSNVSVSNCKQLFHSLKFYLSISYFVG